MIELVGCCSWLVVVVLVVVVVGWQVSESVVDGWKIQCVWVKSWHF